MRWITRIFLVCLGGAFAACGGNSSVVDQIETGKIQVDSLKTPESLFLGHVRQVLVRDSVLYIWDIKSPSMMLAVKYPSLEPICEFMPKGKGPEELLGLGGFDLDDRYLYVMASREPKMAIYALDSLKQGARRPLRIVEYPNEVSPSLAFAKANGDTVVLQSAGVDRRVQLCDTSGHILRVQYALPEGSKTNETEPALMPYLWQSRIAFRGGWLVLAARLGEVLEICHPADTVQKVVVVGSDGAPVISPEGFVGEVNGFIEVRIAEDKIYAIYSGVSMKEVDRIFEEGGNAPSGGRYFRVYDLNTGQLERIYELDRYISTFDVLPDGRTVIAADPNSEHQLCTFTLPD